jgi:hypothetical protein
MTEIELFWFSTLFSPLSKFGGKFMREMKEERSWEGKTPRKGGRGIIENNKIDQQFGRYSIEMNPWIDRYSPTAFAA